MQQKVCMLVENNWFISWSIREESMYQTCKSRVDSLVACKQSRLRRKFGGRAGKKDKARKYSPYSSFVLAVFISPASPNCAFKIYPKMAQVSLPAG